MSKTGFDIGPVALTGTGDFVVIPLDANGRGNKIKQVTFDLYGTFSGTIRAALSINGTTWRDVHLFQTGSSTVVLSTTNGGMYTFNTYAAKFAKIYVSAYTSGSPTIVAYTSDEPTGIGAHQNVNLSSSAATVTVAGAEAHDAVPTANPVRVAGRARNFNPTAVSATGDVADIMVDMIGRQVTLPYAIPESTWQYAAASGGITNTTDVAAKAAAAAGVRNYITNISLKNANAVATEFVVKDGATVIYRTHLPASMSAPEIVRFPVPLRGTAATAVNVACITTGAQVYCNIQGYIAP